MTIDPKDFRTLLIRLALVTAALRAAPLFTADFSPSEAALALGLGAQSVSTEPLGQLAQHWSAVTLAAAGLWRLPALLLEVALPLLAIGYARVAGWGSLTGLVAGLALALGPWAMQASHRVGNGSLTAVLALLALILLRGGIKAGDVRRIGASALPLLALALLAAPGLTVVPAGIYVIWRAVADDRTRAIAAGCWLGAPALGLTVRWLWLGYLVPEIDFAGAAWLVPLAAEPSGWAQAGALGGGAQLAVLASPMGPTAALAAQLDLVPTPWWNVALGAGLLVAAVYGAATGLVHADPPRVVIAARRPVAPKPDAAEDADDEDEQAASGAAAPDRWRSLGVTLPAAARELGDRDWGPPLVALAAAAAYAGQAAARGVADGLVDAAAVARVAIALALGAGLAGLATPRSTISASGEPRTQRRSYVMLGAMALLLFATGAWHLLVQTQSIERLAPRKVAHYAKDASLDAAAVGQGHAAFLAIGARGLPVAVQLDPSGASKQLRVSAAEAGVAAANLIALLYAAPTAVVLFGDAAALGAREDAGLDQKAVLRTLDRTLQLAGFSEVADSHRLLGSTAVVVYNRPHSATDRATIRPQLQPGVAP